MTRTLLWFQQDLRLMDNPALREAVKGTHELTCLYCADPALRRPGRYHCKPVGDLPWRFILDSLDDLARSLVQFGQRLWLRQGDPLTVLPEIIKQRQIDRVVVSAPIGLDERRQWQTLMERHPDVVFEAVQSHTLFRLDQLPFSLDNLPGTFSQFRKAMEAVPVRPHCRPPTVLPPPPGRLRNDPLIPPRAPSNSPFRGGERPGRRHLNRYFAGSAPQSYKQTRNALDDWRSSTKFSPWLARGCLSARQVWAALSRHEHYRGANESTAWIRFELLWREYFQWYALAHGSKLFAFTGIQNIRRPTTFYAERFSKWCRGQTPFPIVNAAMSQLNATGYLSNRARQIVASAFVHELGLDWRYGAAYFQQQLLDYDVASNWGNWQYLAGVGADPRGWRHFDLAKQTEIYDPDGAFIRRWAPTQPSAPLDSHDEADWPRRAP
ncbi:DASH family cryptochrome [Ferrimonas gelatinilytica]|uniref:Cryptochrome DASH n=1 Tax=Ferrimonas gelatinilytica TaxID=1255257 RepID=A0ABP9S6J8_9GAMM